MKLPLVTITLASLLVSGCQTTAIESAKPDEALQYRAIGNEPFWDLKIEKGSMAFDHSGEVTAKANSFTTQPKKNGWRYIAKELTADIRFEECSDGMSEFTYKDSVTVMVGSQKYEGCGGGILPPDVMERTSWRVTSINGAEIAREREALFEFSDGRISGTIGCNRMGADYTYNNKKLSFGPMMSTKIGCPDPIATQEYAFAAVLGALASTEFPGDASMVLTGKDGVKIVLQQMM